MLRDKFIHYFQQWRERQLSRGEHWLTQHLAGRSPREKGMLLAAVVFLFSAGYYVLIWQPLSERIEQQETILQQLEGYLQQGIFERADWEASLQGLERIFPTVS